MKLESREQTPEILQMLRNAGVVVPIEHEGNFYFGPGGGLTTAATSTKVSMACLSIKSHVRNIAYWLALENNPQRVELHSHGITDPEFAFGANDIGLFIGELNTPHGYWQLTRSGKEGPTNPMEALNDLLLPQWAASTLINDLYTKHRA